METKKWILLRGLARGRGHWGSFADRIQERFPDHEFEFLDLPGNGERYQEISPTKMSEFVKQIRGQSQFVSRHEKFKILSISLGSMITVEWMREFPHEVSKAYLMCTSSGGLSPFYQRFLLSNYPRAFKILGAHDVREKEKIILQMTANSHDRIEAELPKLSRYSEDHPIRESNLVRQLLAASQYRFPNQAPGEVQLIGSYGDRLVSPRCTLEIGKKWGIKAHMHPWAGHDIAIDDPLWLLEQLF